MRIRPVIIGLILVFIAVPGYLDTPTLMSQMVHYMMGSMMGSSNGSIPGAGSGSILKQMGYPSRSTVVPLIQYSFVGLLLTGLGFIGFGAIARKITSQVTVNLVTGDAKEQEKAEQVKKVKEIHTSPQFTDERMQIDNRSLRILQERLAKGEITANEFQNLKRLLE